MGKTKLFICLSFTVLFAAAASNLFAEPLGKLKVSSNGRFLLKPDGSAFVWIGDTMWCACTDVTSTYGCRAALSDADQDYYLDKRKSQGYTVIQTNIGSGGSQVLTQYPTYLYLGDVAYILQIMCQI